MVCSGTVIPIGIEEMDHSHWDRGNSVMISEVS